MVAAAQFPSNIVRQTATIASGSSLSDAIALHGTSLVGLILPAALTGASVSIHAAATATGTYYELTDTANTDLDLAGAAVGKQVFIDPMRTLGAEYIKIKSASNEGAERVFTVISRPV